MTRRAAQSLRDLLDGNEPGAQDLLPPSGRIHVWIGCGVWHMNLSQACPRAVALSASSIMLLSISQSRAAFAAGDVHMS